MFYMELILCKLHEYCSIQSPYWRHSLPRWGKLLGVESNKKVTELSSRGDEQGQQVHLLIMGIKKKQLDLGCQWQNFLEYFLIKCIKVHHRLLR